MLTKRMWRVLTAFGLALVLLAGCRPAAEPVQSTIFAMDTVMNLTLWGEDQKDAQAALEDGVDQIYQLERLLSATDTGSEIFALNREGRANLSPDTAQLLSAALELCAQTEGALDITAYPAVEAWGFVSGEYRIPGTEELEELASRIGYSHVTVKGETAALPEGMKLDLGAVAKGYGADRLSALVREQGVASALLDLGQSTIAAVGSKPDGSPWRIGIQDPQGEGYLGVLELEDLAMGTSGGYQRFFEENGVRYWHIIDPDTAAPARSGLASVTVVAPSGLVCDGLSTALFVMGLEDGIQFWRDHPELDFEVLFILEDGSLVMTSGLEGRFSLERNAQGRKLEVVS